MTNTFKQKLLLGTALVAVGAFAAAPAFAVDKSADIEAGTAVTINGADTFVIDVTNDGETKATTVNFAGAGANTFTISSNGLDASGTADQAELGAISVTNTGGTNTFTFADATNGNNLALVITGAISGDVATDANDLRIVVNALTTNDAGDSTLDVNGNVDLGTGTITLTGDANDLSVFLVSGTAAQTITGDIISTTNNQGSSVVVGNGTNTATFASDIGVLGANGVELLTVGTATAGGQAIFNGDVNAATITVAGTTAASSANFNSDVEAGTSIAITGAAAGAATANFAGDVTAGGIVLTKATNDATITFDGTAAQTITGAITGGGDGQGAIAVSNTGGLVTFASAIGVVGGSAIGSLTLSSGADIDISNDVSVDTLTGTGTVNVSASAEVETAAGIGATGAAVTFSVDVGQVLTLSTEATGTSFANVALDGIASGVTFDVIASETFTGDITATVAGEGDVIIETGAFTTAIVGNIGTSSKSVDTFDIQGGGSANVVTLTGNLYADTITVNDADTLRFQGTTAQTVSGDIADGLITVGNGATASNVTFDGALTSVVTALINDKATAVFNDDVTTTTSFVTDGTVTVAQNKTVTSAAFAVGAAEGTINLTIGTTAAGVENSATLASGNALDLDLLDGTTANGASLRLVKGTGIIANGSQFFVGNGTGTITTMVVNTAETVADDIALLDFDLYRGDSTLATLAGTDDSDIVAIAEVVDTSSVTINENNANAAEGILDVTVAEYAADTELASLYDAVTRASTSEIDEVVESIQATVDGGNVVAATTVSNITSNIIQLASLDAEGSGIAAGNISNGLRAWAQLFGQTGQQDDRDGIDGYDIDTYGFAVGLDTQALADQVVLGLAFSYADSEVDSDNANNTTTEIDTYQITLYGTYNVDEATYVSGQLGYAFGDNSTERDNLGGTNLDASGDFDSNQFIARLEAGRAYEVGSMTTLTPKVLANYNYYDADSYRETGAGGAGLNVDQDTLHVFELGAGVDADWTFQQADGSYLKPQVRLGFRYDLADDEVETTSSFIGGGSAFNTEGFDPQEYTVDAGVGVTYFSTANWELTANYDYEYKEDYDSHAGFLRAGYKF